LTVASEPGKGSTFTLTLPSAIASGAPGSVSKKDVERSSPGAVPAPPPAGATAIP